MKQSSAPASASPISRAITRILGWPRLARIVLVSLFTLAAALLLQPVIDNIYLTYFFQWESQIVTDFQRQIPSLITAGIALAIFALGWWLLIGFAGTVPPPRMAALIYFLAGIGIAVLAIAQIVAGLVSMMPAS